MAANFADRLIPECRSAANFARTGVLHKPEPRLALMSDFEFRFGIRRPAALLADSVLFDFVLKGTEADAENFGRLLPMVCNLGESAANRFTLDVLEG